ncbi:MAG: hypothetical protein HQL44_15535 [Alphaproteobacteria bacterium]|nr:hypothetical protein [Alphaproteobacteria bacterium]
MEVRAGKEELNKWNLRTFNDLERMAGDVFVSIMDAIRYTVPSSTDANKSRWETAPFWKEAQDVMRDSLADYIIHAERGKAKEIMREDLLRQLRQQIIGLNTSYAVAKGLDISEIPTIIAYIEQDMMREAVADPEKLIARYQRASDRYIFLNEERRQE